jgi:REP element-mobilizing transposase RayT
MDNDRFLPARRSVRLRNYDYRAAGAYFVTVCAAGRGCLFGEIADGATRFSPDGERVLCCWQEVPRHFPTVELDEWQLMPNHLHGILVITRGPPSQASSDLHEPQTDRRRAPSPRAGSLAVIVGSFKAAATRAIRGRLGQPSAAVWQGNYYEHVIRNEDSLNRIREYVATNPLRWELDRENPSRTGEDDFDAWMDSMGGMVVREKK